MNNSTQPGIPYSEMVQNWRKSFTAKIIMIALVVLLCQIPVLMVDGLISRRQNLARDVENEIASKWGSRQKVSGPLLAIPVSRLVKRTEKEGKTVKETVATEYSTYFAVPQELQITGELIPEMRYRGIYEVVLYRSHITLSGNIQFPKEVENWQLHPEKSRLIVGIADLTGLSAIQSSFHGKIIMPEPGIAAKAPVPGGFSVPLKQATDGKFDISFDLNGCRELLFSMAGRQTTLQLQSSWPSPSFCGAFLPAERTVSEKGFSAKWSVSEFNRDLPASWVGNMEKFQFPDKGSHFGTGHFNRSAGVTLKKVADSYAQVNRAVEYAILVFIIVLMAMLIAEKLSRVWVHPLQYFIAALSLVLFYTLTLAISEHSSFGTAYLISAAAVAALGGFYSGLIYRKLSAALGMFLSVGISYAAIYVILRLEDYALLAGSVILFILMTVLMTFTGRINRQDMPAVTGK
ncbi:MAG: cell envelope integrity protein CreD [Lentisphaeria bacterium]|nr:cell envelope integrity protein CreD [Lentisphaeria bacterium]